MKKLIKPRKLSIGDTVAAISLSGGAAGESNMLPWYNVAKGRLMDNFGLNVVETKYSMTGKDFLYENPEKRAEDLMDALYNPYINGIFLNMGGDDTIRILPYIDINVIRDNPKIFMGFADGTVIHYMFLKAGISSFYGPNLLTTLSEPVELHEYTERWMKKVLFSTDVIGNVESAEYIANEPIDWENGFNKKRNMIKNAGYDVIQGSGVARGRLIGGGLGPITHMIKGTELFPCKASWKGCILFIDIMPLYAEVKTFIRMLRSLAVTGVFKVMNGILISNTFSENYYAYIKDIILTFLRTEEGLTDIPVMMNADFGHTAPMNCIPYGAMAEIDCESKTFRILESGVTE